MKHLCFFLLAMLLSVNVLAQEAPQAVKDLENKIVSLEHQLDAIKKAVDDVQWYNRVGDVAFIDKVYITGPPVSEKQQEKKPTAMGIGNPLKFYAYVFMPRVTLLAQRHAPSF